MRAQALSTSMQKKAKKSTKWIFRRIVIESKKMEPNLATRGIAIHPSVGMRGEEVLQKKVRQDESSSRSSSSRRSEWAFLLWRTSVDC